MKPVYWSDLVRWVWVCSGLAGAAVVLFVVMAAAIVVIVEL